MSLSSPGIDWAAGTWTAAAAIGTLASAIAAAVSAIAARRAVREAQRSQEHSGEERAQRYLEDALSRLGGDPGSLFLLEVKADPRDFVRAGQLISLAIKAAPNLAWARIYHVGYLFHGGGRDRQALDESYVALRCAANAEERVLVLNQQGILFARLRRFKEAEDSLSRALDLGIYSDATWMNRAWTLQEQGRNPEALDSYQKAIEANRYKEEAYRQRADLLRHLGEDREAARTWASLGCALLDQGDRRAAFFPLLMAKASSDLSDDWGDLEGKVRYLAGEVEAAESLLSRAKELGQLDEAWSRRLAGEEEPVGGRDRAKPAFPG